MDFSSPPSAKRRRKDIGVDADSGRLHDKTYLLQNVINIIEIGNMYRAATVRITEKSAKDNSSTKSTIHQGCQNAAQQPISNQDPIKPKSPPKLSEEQKAFMKCYVSRCKTRAERDLLFQVYKGDFSSLYQNPIPLIRLLASHASSDATDSRLADTAEVIKLLILRRSGVSINELEAKSKSSDQQILSPLQTILSDTSSPSSSSSTLSPKSPTTPHHSRESSLGSYSVSSQCPSCGGDGMEENSSGTERVCCLCGYVMDVWADGTSMGEQAAFDEMMEKGRESVDAMGNCFSNRNDAHARLTAARKIMLDRRIESLCRQLGAASEGQIASVKRLLADFFSHFRRRPTDPGALFKAVAACCYISLRLQGEPVPLTVISKRSGLSVQVLGSQLRRVCLAVGLINLPFLPPSDLIRLSITKVLRSLTQSNESDNPLHFDPVGTESTLEATSDSLRNRLWDDIGDEGSHSVDNRQRMKAMEKQLFTLDDLLDVGADAGPTKTDMGPTETGTEPDWTADGPVGAASGSTVTAGGPEERDVADVSLERSSEIGSEVWNGDPRLFSSFDDFLFGGDGSNECDTYDEDFDVGAEQSSGSLDTFLASFGGPTDSSERRVDEGIWGDVEKKEGGGKERRDADFRDNTKAKEASSNGVGSRHRYRSSVSFMPVSEASFSYSVGESGDSGHGGGPKGVEPHRGRLPSSNKGDGGDQCGGQKDGNRNLTVVMRRNARSNALCGYITKDKEEKLAHVSELIVKICISYLDKTNAHLTHYGCTALKELEIDTLPPFIEYIIGSALCLVASYLRAGLSDRLIGAAMQINYNRFLRTKHKIYDSIEWILRLCGLLEEDGSPLGGSKRKRSRASSVASVEREVKDISEVIKGGETDVLEVKTRNEDVSSPVSEVAANEPLASNAKKGKRGSQAPVRDRRYCVSLIGKILQNEALVRAQLNKE